MLLLTQPTPGSQWALFATYSYHGCITDRDGETLELEADHRRQAEIENAIRDLKYGVGLNHLPSGRFAANGAWLAVQVIAHNLARWTAHIGLGEQLVTTKTLRRRFFSLAGRLTRSARRLTLHLPQRWPWENQFSDALARLRALPLHPAYGTSPPTRANSVREGHSLPTACRIPPAMAARPPSSCRCGCLAPPSSPSIGIWLGPFAFPYPSSMVSTTRTSRFGGFGLNQSQGGMCICRVLGIGAGVSRECFGP